MVYKNDMRERWKLSEWTRTIFIFSPVSIPRYHQGRRILKKYDCKGDIPKVSGDQKRVMGWRILV